MDKEEEGGGEVEGDRIHQSGHRRRAEAREFAEAGTKVAAAEV
jgi:hypothetical protein